VQTAERTLREKIRAAFGYIGEMIFYLIVTFPQCDEFGWQIECEINPAALQCRCGREVSFSTVYKNGIVVIHPLTSGCFLTVNILFAMLCLCLERI
jgi:hypothetical protein